MLFHGYIHVTWLLSCQISGSKNTFFNSRPRYSRLLSVFKPLQVSQAAQAGSTVACLDRASIRCKLSKRPLFFSWLVMPYFTHLPPNCVLPVRIHVQVLACAGPGCRRERSFKLYQNECDSVNEARRKCKKARFVLFFLLKLTSIRSLLRTHGRST